MTGCASTCGTRGSPTSFSSISRPWCVCIANRYDRFTHDVEQVTGQPPQTVEQYIGSHPELFA